jgi:hypothetical protein
MAQDVRSSAVMFSPRQPTFGTNILLLLIVIGLAVMILLMLFWFPRYGWLGGAKVIGADGKTMTGGGGVVINAACCDNTGGRCPSCPTCPGTPPPTITRTPCEERCYKRYMTSQTAYESCVRQECTTGGTPTQPQTPTTPTGTPGDCVDSDGSDTTTAGSVTYNGQTYNDDCADDMRVGEWVCRSGKPDRVVMTCPGKCVRGMCVPTGVTAYV